MNSTNGACRYSGLKHILQTSTNSWVWLRQRVQAVSYVLPYNLPVVEMPPDPDAEPLRAPSRTRPNRPTLRRASPTSIDSSESPTVALPRMRHSGSTPPRRLGPSTMPVSIQSRQRNFPASPPARRRIVRRRRCRRKLERVLVRETKRSDRDAIGRTPRSRSAAARTSGHEQRRQAHGHPEPRRRCPSGRSAPG